MENTIMVGRAARLNGDADGTYRSIISQHLRQVGKRHGRDRWVNYPETILLRTMTELTSGNLTLKDAAKRALGLFPFIRDVALGKLGDEQNDVFAVDLWGLSGGEMRRCGYVCEGRTTLAKCIETVALGWPNLRIINLSQVVAETNVGWVLETRGEEEGARVLLEKLSGDDPRRSEMVAVIREMSRRLRGGRRRAEVAVNDNWQMWGANAA